MCLDLSIPLRANQQDSHTHWIWLLKQREEKLCSILAFSEKNPANGKCLTMLAFVFPLTCSAVPNLLFAVRQKPGQITCLSMPIQRKGTKVSESAIENGVISLTLYKYLNCKYLSYRNSRSS